jgi:hypothetical protein
MRASYSVRQRAARTPGSLLAAIDLPIPAGGQRLADPDRQVGVVDAVGGEGAEVLDLHPAGAGRLDGLGAQRQPGVIRGGDQLVGHGVPPSGPRP